MCCGVNVMAGISPVNKYSHTIVMDDEDDEDEDDEVVVSQTVVSADDNLPEGMTDREIDSLLNEWAVKNYLTQDDSCKSSSENPDFPKETYVERLAHMPNVIEMPYNDVVRGFIDRYASNMRRAVSLMLGAQNFYMPIFEEALESYQVPLELKYLPVIESALNPGATSRVGAAGLWQFMITTGKQYGLEVTSLIDERRDPVKASYAAAHYLKDLYSIFGNWTLCVAAYNCGPGNVNKAIKRAGGVKDFWTIYPYLPAETRGYVPAFIAANYIFNYYCEHNICPVNTRLPLSCDTIMVNKDLHMEQVRPVTGLDMEELKALNPQYRTDIIPGSARPCALKLPTTAVNAFLEAGDSIYTTRAEELFVNRREVAITDERPAVSNRSLRSSGKRGRSSRSSGRSVTVRKGDTLGAIARRNGTTVEKLKRVNGIKGSMIRPGQKLRF